MSAPVSKRCFVAYATPERQYLWTVDLPPLATVADALAAARAAVHAEADSTAFTSEAADSLEGIDWESAPVGIFGESCGRADIPRDGDRIEMYRPLRSDPRQRRRERVQRQRKRARQA
jgi:hypothetical protein